jgi:hypothetical protein
VREGAAQERTDKKDKEFLAEFEQLIEPHIRPKKAVRTRRELEAGNLLEVSKLVTLRSFSRSCDCAYTDRP